MQSLQRQLYDFVQYQHFGLMDRNFEITAACHDDSLMIQNKEHAAIMYYSSLASLI